MDIKAVIYARPRSVSGAYGSASEEHLFVSTPIHSLHIPVDWEDGTPITLSPEVASIIPWTESVAQYLLVHGRRKGRTAMFNDMQDLMHNTDIMRIHKEVFGPFNSVGFSQTADSFMSSVDTRNQTFESDVLKGIFSKLNALTRSGVNLFRTAGENESEFLARVRRTVAVLLGSTRADPILSIDTFNDYVASREVTGWSNRFGEEEVRNYTYRNLNLDLPRYSLCASAAASEPDYDELVPLRPILMT